MMMCSGGKEASFSAIDPKNISNQASAAPFLCGNTGVSNIHTNRAPLACARHLTVSISWPPTLMVQHFFSSSLSVGGCVHVRVQPSSVGSERFSVIIARHDKGNPACCFQLQSRPCSAHTRVPWIHIDRSQDRLIDVTERDEESRGRRRIPLHRRLCRLLY